MLQKRLGVACIGSPASSVQGPDTLPRASGSSKSIQSIVVDAVPDVCNAMVIGFVTVVVAD